MIEGRRSRIGLRLMTRSSIFDLDLVPLTSPRLFAFDPVCFRPNIFLNSIPEFISDLHVKLVGLFAGSENYVGVNAADKAKLGPHVRGPFMTEAILLSNADFDSGRVTKRAREIERPLIQIFG